MRNDLSTGDDEAVVAFSFFDFAAICASVFFYNVC